MALARRARERGSGLLAVVAAPVGILVLSLSTSAQAAGGAFVVDDTEIGKPGGCKIESWASFASNADFLGVMSPACVANLGRPVELSFSLARFRSDGEWGSELALKGKTNIIPAEIGKIRLALSGAVAFDLVTGEHSASAINVPATFPIERSAGLPIVRHRRGHAGWPRINGLHERREIIGLQCSPRESPTGLTPTLTTC